MNKAGNEIAWTVEGMTCSNCAATVTRFLERKGMKNVFVDFSTGAVKFEANGDFNEKTITSGIKGLGYRVADQAKNIERKDAWINTLEGKFFISLAFTIPLLLHMVFPFHFLHNPILQFALSVPVIIIGVSYFGKSAWGSIREGVPNMDVLIFIGSTAAFIYSTIGTFIINDPDYLFYETAASIITLVLLGNVIEKRSVKKTRAALDELTRLQPQKAKLIEFYGDEKFEVITEIDFTQIRKGQYFLVNTGDRIPADGEVSWGYGWVDEAMITGESIPVEKNFGSTLIAGTILKEGTIKMKATAIGDETALSRIISMVSDAQRNKPKIQRLADRITSIFVPAVLFIAVLTLLVGYFGFDLSFQKALLNSIGVLVISCPCAMGLATPTAVMVGIGRAAKKGILIKGAKSLEVLASVRIVVFDKTGTLTNGRFILSRLQPIGTTEDELKNILVSLEKFSSHPIAKSIVETLEEGKSFPLTMIVENKGFSVTGVDAHGNRYEAGSFKIASHLTTDSSFNVYVLKNDTLVGMAEVRDEVRADAKETIHFLKEAGIKTVMLSGDRKEICSKIAAELGIDEYYAENLPDEKLEVIQRLRNEAPVAMIGDGINDAPALTAASIGVSLSNATQVAIDAAEVILLNSNLQLLSEAFRISRHTLITIKQNLFWAFFYNVLAIPIAAVGLLKPLIAAFSMAFSDVIVIGNSLRLRAKKLS